MPRIKITVAYIGTRYVGWQIQPPKVEHPQPTIQGEIEKVLTAVTGTLVRVHGSGRTDSGVHADAQVAHFDLPEKWARVNWQKVFTTKLPHDIAVTSVETIDDEFHSRFSSIGKSYTYTLWLNNKYVLPARYPFVWKTGPLDIAAMETAAESLTGEHDFASFQNIGTDITRTVRTMTRISHNCPDYAQRESLPDELVWTFEATGFLKQMVRNLMGTLVACGRHKITPESVLDILAAKDRTVAPATAPACGLCMHKVFY
ncbi:tRNA pseudouridine(38-40) synthase TruA [Halodesulfovibrio marinisediminis]|uniref:tRNA pseudouridine synthase A n=1 Tax=Halodesulfovibrio marinisediminis DSM 17456 TaxID=1121457 RepID=A0A1N6G0E9_9BACT|nr:tRNA pseudouridine(38-40) synthase TruA [Halodesulfovibrio marinisediminis]SIO01056.1 tRNA pseudouridine38-40 synthase [Halodesulfovibrio marinisediminis DSM 17456]